MSDTLLMTPVPTSMLAVVTTVHLAILLLFAHRHAQNLRHVLLLLPSAVFSTTPWILPTPPGVTLGLILNFAWYVACQRQLSAQVARARPAAAPATAPRPAPKSSAAPAPQGFVQVPVFNVIRETDDIATFRMARPEGFEFKPGQFLTVRVNVDGKPVARCYTISSPPEAIGYLEISVKRQGLLSGTLHSTVRPGSMIAINAAAGGFVYPDGDDRPVVLIAGGVGITPMTCMLRHAVQADPTRPVTLLYSVHTNRDVAFREELRLLAARHPQVNMVVTTTRGPHETEYFSGRIDRRMIQEHVGDPANSIFMICGPGPMIDAMKSTLAEIGVPPAQIRSEAFEAAVASSTATDAPQEENAAAEPAGGEFALRLIESGTTLAARPGNTILETCEEAGVLLPVVCRAGACGSCRTRLAKGRVRCESEVLGAEDEAAGYILPCVSWPEEDCALEA